MPAPVAVRHSGQRDVSARTARPQLSHVDRSMGATPAVPCRASRVVAPWLPPRSCRRGRHSDRSVGPECPPSTVGVAVEVRLMDRRTGARLRPGDGDTPWEVSARLRGMDAGCPLGSSARRSRCSGRLGCACRAHRPGRHPPQAQALTSGRSARCTSAGDCGHRGKSRPGPTPGRAPACHMSRPGQPRGGNRRRPPGRSAERGRSAGENRLPSR